MNTEPVVWRVAIAAVVLALMAGCASPRSTQVASTAPAIHAEYQSVQQGGEADGAPELVDVIAQDDRFRMALSDPASPDEVYQTVVWDGKDLLLLEGDDASRQVNPPDEERPPSFILRIGDATFERLCPGGERGGPARVAARAGTVYSCPAHGTGDAAIEGSQITVDDETGLLLRSESSSGHMVAQEVELGVSVDEGTFSTEIPAGLRGPEDATDDSGTPLPLTATDSVPRAGGGRLLLAVIRHGPSLVVIGELPGVTEMVARVLPETGQGKAPRVFVLLNPIPFDEGATQDQDPDLSLATDEGTKKLIDQVSAQVSKVPVPVGIDIKGGAAGEDLRSFEDLMAGTTVLAAIDESGALAFRLTDEELAASPSQLDDWIAANS